MLNDPLYLGVPDNYPLDPTTAPNTTVTTVLPLHRIGIGDGSAKYSGLWPGSTQNALLTTTHSLTNENKPYDTKRTLTRLDLPVETGDANGKIVKASAYNVLVQPITSALSADTMVQLAMTLALMILNGSSTSSSNWAGNGSDDTLYRLLNGEA
jgi:hypothetical protein